MNLQKPGKSVKRLQSALSSVKKQFPLLSDVQKDRLLTELLPDLVPFFSLSGVNELHNHAYRDRFLHPLRVRLEQEGKGIHGADVLPGSKFEYKTMSNRSKRIGVNTPVGQIDKIHLKLDDPNYRTSHLLAGIFGKDEEAGTLKFAVFLSKDDFSKYMDDHVSPDVKKFLEQNKGHKKKARDTHTIKICDLLPYSSFRIVEWRSDLVTCDIDIIKAQSDPKVRKSHLMYFPEASK